MEWAETEPILGRAYQDDIRTTVCPVGPSPHLTVAPEPDGSGPRDPDGLTFRLYDPSNAPADGNTTPEVPWAPENRPSGVPAPSSVPPETDQPTQAGAS